MWRRATIWRFHGFWRAGIGSRAAWLSARCLSVSCNLPLSTSFLLSRYCSVLLQKGLSAGPLRSVSGGCKAPEEGCAGIQLDRVLPPLWPAKRPDLLALRWVQSGCVDRGAPSRCLWVVVCSVAPSDLLPSSLQDFRSSLNMPPPPPRSFPAAPSTRAMELVPHDLQTPRQKEGVWGRRSSAAWPYQLHFALARYFRSTVAPCPPVFSPWRASATLATVQVLEAALSVFPLYCTWPYMRPQSILPHP